MRQDINTLDNDKTPDPDSVKENFTVTNAVTSPKEQIANDIFCYNYYEELN